MLKVVGASWMKIRMSTWIIGVVLVLGIVVIILGQMGQLEEDGNYSATVYWDEENGFEIKFWGQGLDFETIPKGVARIYYQSHIDTTGWAVIDIETQSDYPDWVQAYGAGMLEGSLSWQFIYWHWQNTVRNVCENRKNFCNYVKGYLNENLNSVKKLLENTNDPYWHQIRLFYLQLEGMKAGFDDGVKRSRQTIEELQMVDFTWLNAARDVVDLEWKFHEISKFHGNATNRSQVENSFPDSVAVRKMTNFIGNRREKDQNCGFNMGSAFVRLLPEEGKLFVAHNTAGPYASMLRMIKNYYFRYRRSAVDLTLIENKLTFSSYPGAIHSMDDFYIVSRGENDTKLVIAGTPISIYNKNLWKFVSPLRQLLSGFRTIAASRLSSNGSTWAEYLSRHNSGTANKQWVIIDVEKFRGTVGKVEGGQEKPYREILNEAEDILWVAEQIPTLFVAGDQTEMLKRKSYWASYGLPFYKNVSELSGVNEIREIYGEAFSYANSSLAKIYRRDHEKARSVNSTINLMRSNSYVTDPFSLGDPRCAIGARGDVVSHPFPVGVIDSKVYSVDGVGGNGTNNSTSSGGGGERVFWAIAGPAHSGSASTLENRTEEEEVEEEGGGEEETKVDSQAENRLKPFSWAEGHFVHFPHNGHPDDWNFNPIRLSLRNPQFSGNGNR